jgi:two-component system, OmpR family, sensor histidine kinase ChvG
MTRLLREWRASRIGLRLLAFNVLVVFVPIVGVLYLDVYEARMLEAQERAMVQQGRILAAAVGGSSAIDRLAAQQIIARLARRNDARLRVFDRESVLLADSAEVVEQPTDDPAASRYEPGEANTRLRFLYRIGAALVRAKGAVTGWLSRAHESASNADSDRVVASEVQTALAGRYGAATRPTRGQRSLTLYSAVPVRNGDTVVGAVLVSQSTFRILQALYAVRLRIFEIVVASLGVAAVLTMVSAMTIVRPLARLRRTAVSLAERRRPLPHEFPGTQRKDEIGELARALEDLTRRLSAHIALLESFTADVSHEFKNPLAGIRTAAETIDTSDPAERSRFLALMFRDIERLERLVSSLRELATIDGRLEQREPTSIDVRELVCTVAEGIRLRSPDAARIEIRGSESCRVVGDAQSLSQVFENLVANAVSFSPDGSTVEVLIGREGRSCRIRIEDRGPGIPEAHLKRIFDRFFTYRPNEARREHLGLGLAIAQRIVHGHGGTTAASNREGGGAVLEVRLPADVGRAREPRRAHHTRDV